MFLTEIIETTEAMSVFEIISQRLWGGVFTWKDLFEFIITISGVYALGSGVIKWLKNNFLRLSAPYREYKEVIERTLGKTVRKDVDRYYIPTRCQDKDPSNEEEIYEFNGKYVTEKLIPFFCNKAFESDSFGKHYIILADSGMGKTTFLVRLYREYVLKVHLWPKKKLNVCFIPLTATDWQEQIEKVEVPEKTILLLDALDENKEAIKDCNRFLKEILLKTYKFNKVVLTCRTQFFPNQESEPRDTGLTHAGTGRKSSEFIKKYITPFSDREVNQYLRKRFKIKFILRYKAKKIVQKVPVVMARPLILSWIDYLVDSRKPLQYSFEIYDRIIAKWIERECGGQWNDRESGKLTKQKLVRLSNRIAQYMLVNETTVIPGEIVEAMAKEDAVDLEPIIARSRSLLNRNSDGEYKFAHRSFLEFILAKKVFKQRKLPVNEVFLHNMSGFRSFFFEYILNDLRITCGDEELNRFFIEADGVARINIEEAFGPDVIKLYSVRCIKMLDGFICLLVKVAYNSREWSIRYKVDPKGLLTNGQPEYKFWVQEILLGSPKAHCAEIASSKTYWVSTEFYNSQVKPFINDSSSIRYVDWDMLPNTSGWNVSLVDDYNNIHSVASFD